MPWITFEAGALSKTVDKSRVIPLLLDLSVSDLTGPLAQFQAVEASNRDQIFKLIKSIAAASPPLITEDRLKGTFDAFWPALEGKIKKLQLQGSEEVEKRDIRSDRDILEELLTLARRNDQGPINVVSREAISGNAAQPEIVQSGTSRARRQYLVERVLKQLNEFAVPYENSLDEFMLTVTFTEGFTQADRDSWPELRQYLQQMAIKYKIGIMIENGPAGKESYPPF